MGFSSKSIISPFFIGLHNAETRRFFHRDGADRDRAVGARFLMMVHHLVVIHLVNVVARQNNHVFGIKSVDKLDILINRVGGSLVPLARFRAHERRKDVNAARDPVQIPRLSVSYVLVKFKGLILRKHTDRIDAGVCTIRQRKVDNSVLRSERYGRFCNLAGEKAESCALTSCKQHRDTFFSCLTHIISS